MAQRICLFPGCGLDARPGRRLCAGHVSQERRGVPLAPVLRGEPARFWAKVDRPSEAECWNWIASKDKHGYGHFSAAGRRIVKAHRWAWEDAYGPIPPGLTLDHLCRNTSCVNPQHLEPVTHKVNSLRGTSPCAQNARKTHCIHGHGFTEGNTYRRPGRTARVCRACRDERLRQRPARLKTRPAPSQQ